jgi:MscS family membrane protein
MRRKPILYLILTAACLSLLFVAQAGLGLAQTPSEGTATAQEGDEPPETTPTRVLGGVIEERTPVPTATPGRLQQGVTDLAVRTGAATTTFLGLNAADWISLGMSLLLVLAGYLIGTWLIRRLLPRLARRTPTGFDDVILAALGPDLRWLVVILALQFATIRLIFLGVRLKLVLGDVYFILGLLFAFRIAGKLIDLAETWYRQRSIEAQREEQLAPVIALLVRIGRVLLGLVGLTILLSHFGVNVTALATVLGLSGLAISLAARDTIADAIAGFIILVDQPFRIGDRIEIPGVDTWGDVVDIGLRTTRIRTRDNRMVIVPNSVIGVNQVINYTYPDPRYRIQTHVGVAYGTDIETARRVMVESVRGVEGVLADKPVDALYVEMGDSAMIFRVRWWIESYADTRRMFDRVHTALQKALDEAGIESPFPTQTLNLKVEPGTAPHVSGVVGERARPGDGEL